MSGLVYGTCEKCGRERVPGRATKTYRGDGNPVSTGVVYSANMHRAPSNTRLRIGAASRPWCLHGTLNDIEARGTVARPLPASEFDLKKLSDDQLQTLLERVEVEMLRREP